MTSSVCHFACLAKFIRIGPSAAELWRHSDFQDGGRQPCWICSVVMVDHLRRDVRRWVDPRVGSGERFL